MLVIFPFFLRQPALSFPSLSPGPSRSPSRTSSRTGSRSTSARWRCWRRRSTSCSTSCTSRGRRSRGGEKTRSCSLMDNRLLFFSDPSPLSLWVHSPPAIGGVGGVIRSARAARESCRSSSGTVNSRKIYIILDRGCIARKEQTNECFVPLLRLLSELFI